MRKIKDHTVKGSSIVEVLIALAITSFCTSLAMVIYLNIQKSSLPFFKVKAVELAEFYMQEALKKNTLENENFKDEEFTIKKINETSLLFPDCSMIRILVFDGSKKKIVELESLVKRTSYK